MWKNWVLIKKIRTECPLILFDSMYDQNIYLQDICMCITKIPVCSCFLLSKLVIFCIFFKIRYFALFTPFDPLLQKCTFITETHFINIIKFKLVYLDINSTKQCFFLLIWNNLLTKMVYFHKNTAKKENWN